MTTEEQYDRAIATCREVFRDKLADYGTAWRIMRPESLTDQIFIKACRIRGIEQGLASQVDESIMAGLVAIVNYSIIALIQLKQGFSEKADMPLQRAISLYEEYAEEAKQLMIAKNHDYQEAWRLMRVKAYTDIILQKINRTKMIEDHEGITKVSEGIDANYFDMLNYAIFYIIKLTEENDKD